MESVVGGISQYKMSSQSYESVNLHDIWVVWIVAMVTVGETSSAHQQVLNQITSLQLQN